MRAQVVVEHLADRCPAMVLVETDGGLAGVAPQHRGAVGIDDSPCLVEQGGSGAAASMLWIGSHRAQPPGPLTGQPGALFGKYQAGTEKRLTVEGAKMHDAGLVLAGEFGAARQVRSEYRSAQFPAFGACDPPNVQRCFHRLRLAV